MAKYRIVKIKHTDAYYRVEKRWMFFWEIEAYKYGGSLLECRNYIEWAKKGDERREKNPKDVVVEYH